MVDERGPGLESCSINWPPARPLISNKGWRLGRIHQIALRSRQRLRWPFLIAWPVVGIWFPVGQLRQGRFVHLVSMTGLKWPVSSASSRSQPGYLHTNPPEVMFCYYGYVSPRPLVACTILNLPPFRCQSRLHSSRCLSLCAWPDVAARIRPFPCQRVVGCCKSGVPRVHRPRHNNKQPIITQRYKEGSWSIGLRQWMTQHKRAPPRDAFRADHFYTSSGRVGVNNAPSSEWSNVVCRLIADLSQQLIVGESGNFRSPPGGGRRQKFDILQLVLDMVSISRIEWDEFLKLRQESETLLTPGCFTNMAVFIHPRVPRLYWRNFYLKEQLITCHYVTKWVICSYSSRI